MKKLFVIACIAAGFSLSENAQDSTSVKKHHKGNHQKEWKQKGPDQLDLTADQQKQLKDMNADYRQQAKAIKDNQALNETEKKEQMKTLMSKRREGMKSILTPEQQKKMAAYQKNQKKQHHRQTDTK